MKYFIFLLITVFSFGAFAAPACMDRKDRLDYNESRLLLYRDEMEPKFTARAFIKGIIVGIIEDRQKHVHFEVDLDGDLATRDDRIEVIYNTKFGPVPENRPGDELIACGDFVADPYSPFKAVVHWLHMAPKKSNHDHGYMIINGQITGLVNPKAEK
ncbi:hypothetical protein [Bdellovibrio reynosensis]|uniref:DUF3465 domain-containing protein n=1 Tax=Bdellovibrio reynosensis TaxID=2835041 RepID=A0ABY4CDY8_9BACT|nr:hypothetical protein [Bdellovibrio reynosensis]UOF01738.1 hypothetical protein MNR06_02060 [Bdellovibrio reynosensis]